MAESGSAAEITQDSKNSEATKKDEKPEQVSTKSNKKVSWNVALTNVKLTI